MALVEDIRVHVADLLSRELELTEFEDWIVNATWNVHRGPDAAAAPLAYKIELLLSELSGGYRTEEESRASLARLLQDHWAEFSIVDDPPTFRSSGAGTALTKVPA